MWEAQVKTAHDEIGEADWLDEKQRERQIKRLIADTATMTLMGQLDRTCFIALAKDLRRQFWFRSIQTVLLAAILWRAW